MTSITFNSDFCTISFFFSSDREDKLKRPKSSNNSEVIILSSLPLGQKKLLLLLVHAFQIPLFAKKVLSLYMIIITGL